MAETDSHPEILLVDDEQYIISFGRKLFKHLGYDVTVCRSSIEALALVKKDPVRFDLVFTDLSMPKLTGDKLAAEILRIRPEMPVIVFTGYSEQLSAEDAEAIGIKALLYKPLNTSELARVVRRVIDESKMRPGSEDHQSRSKDAPPVAT